MDYATYLRQQTRCPFCSTSRMTQEVITSNDTAFLTFAIAPYHQDHLLICPKKHETCLLDLSDQQVRDCQALINTGLRALHALGYTDITSLVRDGSATGKTIEHIHYHLIPVTIMHAADHQGSSHTVLQPHEIDNVIKRIKSVI